MINLILNIWQCKKAKTKKKICTNGVISIGSEEITIPNVATAYNYIKITSIVRNCLNDEKT